MRSWDKLFNGSSSSELNTYFDKVYFINLDSRKDRLQSITNQLNHYKIDAERITGIIPEKNPYKISKGELGCLLSHKQIWTDALDNNYKSVCVLEDDIIFKDYFPIIFNRFIGQVPDNWDMLYFCGNNFFGLSKIDEYVFKTKGTLTTCSYCIKNTVIKKVIDHIGTDYKKPIDSYLAELHASINTYVAVPSITYQMNDFSDIQNKLVDYSFLI